MLITLYSNLLKTFYPSCVNLTVFILLFLKCSVIDKSPVRSRCSKSRGIRAPVKSLHGMKFDQEILPIWKRKLICFEYSVS